MTQSPKKSPILGVGAVVRRADAVLLVKRKRPPYQGEWAIPGGRVEWGETLAAAAERELMEETGVTIRANEPVYTFEYIEPAKGKTPGVHYVVIDLRGEYIAGEPRAASDAEDAAWVNLSRLQRLALNWYTRHCLATLYPTEVASSPR
ncbi:NUDIX hydrolase [Thiohalomonas denitrificans]|uniref:ADP-ribose pyrophosphatase YjhB, NUDIX family n=1 Tax=Thiohalomonas denitrificans TaxID=415747 RepID=A0A1G5PKQ5_9GAMM|nr:NUDIX hydrolase [Thiohalomonas denitrificans]SCZ49761.1 ADP-ribose pyrophosphatase YjhB, NUDIX family [Thiohalomonas denitrificans]